MKKITLVTLVGILFLAAGRPAVLGQTTTQPTILQKTINTIEDLINAKDAETESLTFRVQTFIQVIDLSIAEARELKLKLLNLGKLEDAAATWLQERLAGLDEVIVEYEDQKKLVATYQPLTLEWVKETAKTFQDWRSEHYLPLADELVNFLLIYQEKKAIETASLRFQKISRDLDTLVSKAGIKESKMKPILDLMKKAESTLKESVDLNQSANDSFWQTASPTTASTTEATATSTTSTLPTATSTATTTEQLEPTSTSTATSTAAAPLPPPSIRDLVGASLDKIKETYQIFIEISKLVRELLI